MDIDDLKDCYDRTNDLICRVAIATDGVNVWSDAVTFSIIMMLANSMHDNDLLIKMIDNELNRGDK